MAYGYDGKNDDILILYKFNGKSVGAIVVDGAGDYE